MKSSIRGKSTKQLPQWILILLGDDTLPLEHVVSHLMRILHIEKDEAEQRTLESQNKGNSVLCSTHLERAEFYKEQFESCVPKIPVKLAKSA